jgi:hypothetical protein
MQTLWLGATRMVSQSWRYSSAGLSWCHYTYLAADGLATRAVAEVGGRVGDRTIILAEMVPLARMR